MGNQKMLPPKEPQISVEKVGFSYEESDQPIFKDLSITFNKNESILLLGPSGSGKSTLAFCLNKLYPEAVDGLLTGDISYEGKKLEEYVSGELNQKIGVVFQDPDSQFCMDSVEDELAFGLENIHVPRHEMEEKIDKALEWVGLTTFKNERINSLSGGQKQKLALACVLSLQPEVIILDEPTANLDPLSTLELVDTINWLKKEFPFTLIVIEHKLDDWLGLIDRCLVLNTFGEMIFDGEPRKCFDEYAPFLRKEGIWLPKVVEAGLLAKEAGKYKNKSLPLYMKELIEGLTGRVSFFIKKARPIGESVLEVTGLSYTKYRLPILKEISFSVRNGELVAIVGANGSGKTTLSKCITGLLPLTQGDIQFKNVRLTNLNEHLLWKKLGYVFQNPEHQFVTDTVFDEIAFDLRLDQRTEYEINRKVSSILKKTNLERFANVHPFSLSQGQKRRLSVATMLVNDQDLLILDEPTFGQDAQTAYEIMNLLVERTKAILMITHDMNLVDQYADRVLVLDKGEMIFFGTPEALWKNKIVLEQSRLRQPFTKQFEEAIVSRGETFVIT